MKFKLNLVLPNICTCSIKPIELYYTMHTQFAEWLQCVCSDDGEVAFCSEGTKQNSWATVTQLLQTSPKALDVLLVRELQVVHHEAR